MNKPTELPVSETLAREGFLGRWSRMKREVAGGAVPPGTVAAETAVEALPSLETLAAQGLDADLSAFMQAGVEEGVRRAAVKQLFKQPVFNVMDGLDVYIEDFNIYEPLTAAELPGLAHAREMLFGAPDQQAATAETTAPLSDADEQAAPALVAETESQS